MEELQGIKAISAGLEPALDLPEPEADSNGIDLFMELFTPSEGKQIANTIIVMRDAYSKPKPSQAFIELVESIVEQYNAGEWATADAEPAEEALLTTGTTETATSAGLDGIAFIEEMPAGSGKKTQNIRELYHEGTLLYAMYPPPEEETKDHLERFKNEGFIMAQAIDAFLAHATSEEREHFRKLSREEQQDDEL